MWLMRHLVSKKLLTILAKHLFLYKGSQTVAKIFLFLQTIAIYVQLSVFFNTFALKMFSRLQIYRFSIRL